MSTWLQRIANRLVTRRDEPSARADITEFFYKRSLYPDTRSFLGGLIELFPNGQSLSEGDLHVLIEELRGLWGPEKALEEGDLDEHVDFWQELATRTSSTYAMACYGDTLLLAGREELAITAFVAALKEDPLLLEEMGEEISGHARRLGGQGWLHFRLAKLQLSIANGAALSDEEIDQTRELYSELLEEFSGDSSSLQDIRAVGQALEAAVSRGEMPRAMVIRGPSRTSN